jgi:hypothetical protein
MRPIAGESVHMESEKPRPKNGHTITLNEGKKVTVLYELEGIVYVIERSDLAFQFEDLRQDEDDPTNWIYMGDTKVTQ